MDANKHSKLEIRQAVEHDRGGVLAVMQHWNMHHVPSPEMGELDLNHFFVAEADHEILAAAGYRLLGGERGKTTLLGISPAWSGRGIGTALQDRRLAAMAAAGVRTVTTNADRPETIAWYKRRYGYREVGTLAKEHEFGLPDVHRWTTLELDLESWAALHNQAA